MPKCYLLTLCGGSSLDQQSNNVTLFNVVEQVNVPENQQPPPGALLPLEIHAYFQLGPLEMNQRFEVRFALVASSGLETFTDSFQHRSPSPRYRTRTLGLPAPPVVGTYELRIDWRQTGSDDWRREPIAWPLVVATAQPRTETVH
jgi:hypothetical protein